MDDKKEKKTGGITHFCLKHLVALMVTALFMLVIIMVYSIGIWAHVEQEKQQIDVELSQLIAEREYFATIKRDLPNMKRQYEQSESELKALNNELNKTNAQFKDIIEKIEAATKKHDSLNAENSRLSDLIAQKDSAQSDLKKVKQELESVKASIESSKDELNKANAELAKYQKKNAEETQKYNDNQKKIKQQSAALEKIEQNKNSLKVETESLAARKDVLVQEISKLSGIDSPVKKLEDLIAKESDSYAAIERELSDITQKLNSSYKSVDKELVSSLESIKSSLSSIKALSSRRDIFDSLEATSRGLNNVLESIRSTQQRVNDEFNKPNRVSLLNDMNAKIQDNSGRMEKLSDSVSSIESNMMALMNKLLQEQQELKARLDKQEKENTQN